MQKSDVEGNFDRSPPPMTEIDYSGTYLRQGSQPQPLSEDAAGAADHFALLAEQSADFNSITFNHEDLYDLRVSHYEGAHKTLPDNDEVVERTLYLRYERPISVELGALLRLFKLDGDWYPFGHRRRGKNNPEVLLLSVKDGEPLLHDRTWYAFRWQAYRDPRGVTEKYEEALRLFEGSLRTIRRHYEGAPYVTWDDL